MSHQVEIEKRKYRNWVRGGLAYKYLKQGLEGFADDVVKQDHKRILSAINYTPGIICTRCIIGNLKPTHACIINSAGKNECYWGQHKCNCLRTKKEKCRLHICDRIMEELFRSHGSTPPTLYWANTDIQRWCTEPWEVAKCFINAPGYSDKTKAADIDISGLLHVFINNTNLHSHLACSMAGKNVFVNVRERRNKLYHSATMEIEEGEMFECIDDIVEILEDPKQLKGRPEVQQAVNRLKQLKNSDFLITTHNEVEVCREVSASLNLKSEEIKQAIQDAKNSISDEKKDIVEKLQQAADKHKEDVKDVSDQVTSTAKKTIQNSIHGAVKEFDKHSEILYKRIKKLETGVSERVEKVETRVSERVEKLETYVSIRVKKLETDVSERLGKLEKDFSSVEKRVTSLERTDGELDCIRQMLKKRLDYVKGKKELQDKLVESYQKYYVKTSLSPLKQQEDSINVKDVYVPPEIEVVDANQSANLDKGKRKTKAKVKGYQDIFQTKGRQNRKIYILGDVGTGKSTFCKMMIENWCTAVTGSTKSSIRYENACDRMVCSDNIMEKRCDDDVSQIGQYEFLFFLPLQNMSTFQSDVIVDMIKELTKDLISDTDLIDRIFQEDSMRCLIIVDSLDEWRPPKDVVRRPHVSYGIPNGDRAKDATVLTLSRPSAKGILNLKKSEIDLQLKLLGISSRSLKPFIKRYIIDYDTFSIKKSYDKFIAILLSKQIEHVEKTPLLLQQFLWLYCNDEDIGESIGETYCQILNTMFGWSDRGKDEDDTDECQTLEDFTNPTKPDLLKKFPRLENNKRVLFLLGRTAFEKCLSGKLQGTNACAYISKRDLPKCDVVKLTRLGILNESKCYNPTFEDTQLDFIHFSYLEFFVALYVTICCCMEQADSRPVKQNNGKHKVVDELLGTCTSSFDVLQLSNVIKMICGLSPLLIGDLSKRISCIVNRDKHISHLRTNECETLYRNDEIVQIQRLMVDCLKECGSFCRTLVNISDLCISDLEPSPSLQRINTDNVISLAFEDSPKNDVVEYLTQCKLLQYLNIECVSFKRTDISLLSEQLSVKQLTLHRVDIEEDDVEEHATVDLTRQNQMQKLELSSCDDMRISGINTEQLKQVHIENCPGIINFEFLSNAQQLTELCIENNDADCVSQGQRYHIDLSNQTHLQTLKMIKCPDILITGLNVEQLEHVHIFKCPTIHTLKLSSSTSKFKELYAETVQLKPILEQLLLKTTLRQLTLTNIRDNVDVDLSRQNQLQTLKLEYCPGLVITGLNTDHLEQGHIFQCSNIGTLKLSSYTSKFKELYAETVKLNPILELLLLQTTLRQLTFTNIRDNVDVDLSRQNQLQTLKVDGCPGLVITGLNTDHLEQVYIFGQEGFSLRHGQNTMIDLNFLSNANKLIGLHIECFFGNVPLVSLLQQKTTLKQLTLTQMYQDQGVLPAIDLSGHNLQKLVLSDCNCMKFYNLNTDHLEHLKIDHGLLDFTLVSNASSLTELCLRSFQYSKQVGNVVHTLHQLRKLTLHNVDIDENALTVTPEMKNLTHIQHTLIRMTLDTWRTFVESLLDLDQSVEVEANVHKGVLREVLSIEKRDFVRTNLRFEVIRDDNYIFLFKSRELFHHSQASIRFDK
ncbi:uncharacterized protein LOC132715039 [Ruditapes philippinarum]|uniref:uncharacterized protein LOC132715039 n=1 Tax=Ruditapes philippinarum TaxID=129788 RepID=UPI00295B467A|nr:uncharacterized protein LOC132715039 [Ruditapes philippinarum]